jgi:hypothetical protein
MEGARKWASNASMASREDANDKKGRFFKNGANNAGLRERFFVLDKQAAVLHYYEDENAYATGIGEKGEVQLRGCHVRIVHDKERLGMFSEVWCA